ncbi:MAG: transposase, partial [Devosia sp.]|nr:transposase [Devosia sp.]
MAPTDPQQLPDDIDALKAMIAAAHAEIAELKVINATADERIARLTSIVAMLQRAQYGTRSERLRHDPLNDEQMAFVFDEIETGIEQIKAGLEARDRNSAAPRPSRPRKGFAPHLERIEQVIEPEVPVDCIGLQAVRIGENVSERLDVTPATFRVIVTRRPKYAYRLADGEDRIVQAPAPDHLIIGGIPTEALLAQ